MQVIYCDVNLFIYLFIHFFLRGTIVFRQSGNMPEVLGQPDQ